MFEKDETGKRILIDGEYKKIQKRYYVEYDYELLERWKTINKDLIDEHLTGTKWNICINTFTKYRPHYIEQTGVLTQFACDGCTEFDFAQAGLRAGQKRVHKCGTLACPNWRAPMGNQCHCDGCTKCTIFKYSKCCSSELLKTLCCESENGAKLLCAEGKCIQRGGRFCGSNKYKSAVLYGRGCHTFSGDVEFEIEFKRIQKCEVDNKKYKYVIHEKIAWKEFVWILIDVIGRYIHHIFVKYRQNGQRKIVCREIDNKIALQDSATFISIDFIGNKKLICKSVTQALNTKLAQVSILVIYECKNVDNKIQESAHIYVSNQTSHGWYSAIPALKHYYKRTQEELLAKAVTFKSKIIYSDRGRSDIWCAPFVAYGCELSTEFDISLQLNTTASGEGKWLHDQIGGTFADFIIHCVKVGKLKFRPNESIAAKIVEYSNQHFNKSKTDSIHRYFYELPVQDIKVHTSPVDSLQIGDSGISDYHCAVIHPNNKIKFRKQSCFCEKSINSDFKDDCDHTEYCGKWIPTTPSKYPKYSEAKHMPKQKKANNKRREIEPPVSEPPPKRRRIIRVPISNNNQRRNKGLPPPPPLM